MNDMEYILANSNLPFSIECDDDDAIDLIAAANTATGFWGIHANAMNHEQEVNALDIGAEWLSNNWREVLPELSNRFPE